MFQKPVVARARAFSSTPAYRPLQKPRSHVLQATLSVGDKLTDFPNYFKVLKNQDNKSVTLSSFTNKSPVVLFFYPKAGTPGCTKEACSFRDKFIQFQKAGAQVFGISSDSPAENKVFKDAQRLPYDLLTDENGILRKEFGIKNELFVLPGRQTYVISKSGECIMSFNDMLNTDAHIAAALDALKA